MPTTNMDGNFRRRSFRKVLYYVLLDSQTVFRGKPTCVNIIMKFDVLLWVLVTLSAILGFLFFGSLIWILIYKIMRKFLKNNNNELNLLPQIEAITNQPLMEVSVQKITLLHHHSNVKTQYTPTKINYQASIVLNFFNAPKP